MPDPAGPEMPDPAGPEMPAGPGTRFLRALGSAGWILLGWLGSWPARLGDRLFAMNDTEAYWRDWQITRTRGGLGRRYRDPSFDLPAEGREVRGLPAPGS